MKTLLSLSLILFLVVILLGAIQFGAAIAIVQAQESPVATPTPIINPDQPPVPPEVPTQIPDTAQASLDWLVVALAAAFASFVGLVESGFIDFLKKRAPWLGDEKNRRIGKGIARILYSIFNLVVGVLVSLALPYVAWLDSSGVWGAILTLIGVTGLPILAIGSPIAAELWHRLSKARA